MSAQRPIILGIDGVARKLVEDASAGLFVEPENAQAFADAVLKLKQAPDFCKKCAQDGFKFVSENFARNVLADKYIDILKNKVVGQRKLKAV